MGLCGCGGYVIGVVSLSWPVSDCALCLWHNVFYIYAWLIYLSMIMIVIIIIQDHVKLTRLVLFDLFFSFLVSLSVCLSIYLFVKMLSLCTDLTYQSSTLCLRLISEAIKKLNRDGDISPFSLTSCHLIIPYSVPRKASLSLVHTV